MQGTQQEIREIQARLQAINKGDVGYRPASSATMVEMFPGHRPQSSPSLTQSQVSTYAFEGDRGAEPTQVSGGMAQTAMGSQSVTHMAGTAAGHSLPNPYLSYSSAAVGTAAPGTPSATEQAALQQLAETWRQLETKADQLNQLSAAQEAMLLEVRAIAQRVERDWRATGLQDFPFADTDGDLSSLYGRDSADVPVIERDAMGKFVMTQRTLELSKAEREAAMMAEVLRKKRQPRSSGLAPLGRTVWNWFQGLLAGNASRPKARRRPVVTSTVVAQPGHDISLPNAAAWLVGATLTRMAIDALLASHPAFWLPAVAVIIAPAAIAAYRTTVAPESSIQWGYRLLLIMVGLLLGGRF
ncbi:hypothetical protein [Vacuolonema iberomarrocanum]|uniref:hypothetical protein n=1 Tax=Vacuolonema iberomarrocanum TaxID=3454632 RepID=UPI0019DAC10B|nr:hypothetical protein [filamentous cyanobacterium LEGE 07170]